MTHSKLRELELAAGAATGKVVTKRLPPPVRHPGEVMRRVQTAGRRL